MVDLLDELGIPSSDFLTPRKTKTFDIKVVSDTEEYLEKLLTIYCSSSLMFFHKIQNGIQFKVISGANWHLMLKGCSRIKLKEEDEFTFLKHTSIKFHNVKAPLGENLVILVKEFKEK